MRKSNKSKKTIKTILKSSFKSHIDYLPEDQADLKSYLYQDIPLEFRHNPKTKTLKPLMRPVPVMCILIIFFLGFFLNRFLFDRSNLSNNSLLTNIQNKALENQSLQDVDKSPFIFTDVRLKKENLDHIHLTFNVTTEVKYSGHINDPLIKDVLTQALVNYTNDGYRLDAVLLSSKFTDTKIKEALIYSLHYDENPAIRSNALDVLAEMDFEPIIQNALIKVLREEEQVNMRLKVIDVLAQKNIKIQDYEKIFRERIEKDNNSSVQIKAKHYLSLTEREI
jgi:hypothetical protein